MADPTEMRRYVAERMVAQSPADREAVRRYLATGDPADLAGSVNARLLRARAEDSRAARARQRA